jgi:ketosteroid isomerase-like protein
MAEHPNATLAREMTDAFDRGDMAALDRVIDDDDVVGGVTGWKAAGLPLELP